MAGLLRPRDGHEQQQPSEQTEALQGADPKLQLRAEAGALGYAAGSALLGTAGGALQPVGSAPPVQRSAGPAVQLWGGSAHKALTTAVAPSGIFDVSELAKASTLMDGNRSGTNENHGEGGLYKEELRGSAAMLNSARQWEYLFKANTYAREYIRLKKLSREDVNANPGAQAELKRRGSYQRECMINRLGDALHVAEDRGAHGEGVPGEGHDWSLTRPGSFARRNDCDDPSKNADGYTAGQTNAKAVMDMFIAAHGTDLKRFPPDLENDTW